MAEVKTSLVTVDKVEPGDWYRYQGKWRKITAVGPSGTLRTLLHLDNIEQPQGFDNGTTLLIHTAAQRAEVISELKGSVEELVGGIADLFRKPGPTK